MGSPIWAQAQQPCSSYLESQSKLKLDPLTSTQLVLAIQSGDLESIRKFHSQFDLGRYLLDVPLGSSVRDSVGVRSAIFFAVVHNSFESARFMLEDLKVKPNLDFEWVSALEYVSARPDRLDWLKFLVDHGCDPNYSGDRDHPTFPLHAAIHVNNYLGIEYLLNHGADPNIEEHYGISPLSRAVEYGNTDIVNLLIQKGARWNERSRAGGNTPLASAAEHIEADLLLYFLSLGAAVDTVDRSGWTPLMWSIGPSSNADYNKLKSRNLDPLSERKRVFEILMQQPLNLNLQNAEGDTALMIAIFRNNQFDAVRILLSKGADPNIENSLGQTALDLAVFMFNPEWVKLIQAAGGRHGSRYEFRQQQENFSSGSMAVTDAFRLLGLSPKASKSEYRSTIRKLLKKFHPDRNSDSDSESKTKQLLEAKAILDSYYDI